jgi:hypothetical protein
MSATATMKENPVKCTHLFNGDGSLEQSWGCDSYYTEYLHMKTWPKFGGPELSRTPAMWWSGVEHNLNSSTPACRFISA